MTTWHERNETIDNDQCLGTIVTHDLKPCMENFDFAFKKIYEQLPTINYSALSEEDRPENVTYIGKLSEIDENAG